MRTQADLAAAELVAFPTVPDVLDAVAAGDVDCGVVPIENSIEGVVNFTQDALAFDYDLLITREIVLDIEHCLVGAAGPDARRRQGRAVDPGRHGAVPPLPARAPAWRRGAHRRSRRPSAAKLVAEGDGAAGRSRPGGHRPAGRRRALRARRCSPTTSPTTPATRPASSSSPATASRRRTGHDRTAMVVYQRADEPGSLISILQEFAARRINLSNLLSRPTKDGGLGDYCFVIYADAHIDDELIADAMRALHAKQGG